MVGLRGVGKTVLLERIRQEAEANGIYTLQIEAPEDRSLPSMIVPQLRVALLKISTKEAARKMANRALVQRLLKVREYRRRCGEYVRGRQRTMMTRSLEVYQRSSCRD